MFFLRNYKNVCFFYFKHLILVFLVLNGGHSLISQEVARSQQLDQSLYMYDSLQGYEDFTVYDAELVELSRRVDSALQMKTLYEFIYTPLSISLGPEEVQAHAYRKREFRIQGNENLVGKNISLIFSFGIGLGEQRASLIDFIDWPEDNEITLEEREVMKLRARTHAENILDNYPGEFKRAAVAYLTSLLDAESLEVGCICYLGKKFSTTDTIFIPKGNYEFNFFAIPDYFPEDSCYSANFSPLSTIGLFPTRIFRHQNDTTLIPDKNESRTVAGDILEASISYSNQNHLATTRVVVVEVNFPNSLTNRSNKTRLIGDWNDNSVYSTQTSLAEIYSFDIIPGDKTYYQYMSDIYNLPYRFDVEIRPKGVPTNVVRIFPDQSSNANVTESFISGNLDSLEMPFGIGGPFWFTDTLKVGGTESRLIKRFRSATTTITLRAIVMTIAVPSLRDTCGTYNDHKCFTPRSTSIQDIKNRMLSVNDVYKKVGVLFELDTILRDTIINSTQTIQYTNTNFGDIRTMVRSSNRIHDAINQNRPVLVVVPEMANTNLPPNSFSGGVSYRGKFVSILPDRTPPSGNSVRNYAHELGHSVFDLRHPFDEFPTLLPGADVHNLMDYEHDNTQLFFHPYQFKDIKEIILPGPFNPSTY